MESAEGRTRKGRECTCVWGPRGIVRGQGLEDVSGEGSLGEVRPRPLSPDVLLSWTRSYLAGRPCEEDAPKPRSCRGCVGGPVVVSWVPSGVCFEASTVGHENWAWFWSVTRVSRSGALHTVV